MSFGLAWDIGFVAVVVLHAGLVFLQCGTRLTQLSQYQDLKSISLPCPPPWQTPDGLEVSELISHRCADHWPTVGKISVTAEFWADKLRRIGLVPLPAYALGIGLLAVSNGFRAEIEVDAIGQILLGLGFLFHISYLIIKYRTDIAPTLCACRDKYNNQLKVLLDIPE